MIEERSKDPRRGEKPVSKARGVDEAHGCRREDSEVEGVV